MSRLPQRSIGRIRRLQPALWFLAVVAFGIGDLVTTAIGLQLRGIAEVGPVAGPVIDQFGVAGMVGLKLLTIGAGYGVWRLLPAPHRVGVPLGLAVVGIAVTGWNTLVVSAVLLV